MTSVLVDSNIFFDVMLGSDTAEWSAGKLVELGGMRPLVVNPIIWSEIGAGFASPEALSRALSGLVLEKLSLSFEVAFRAGQAYRAYRRAGGLRERTLPDFLVGAHAEVEGHALLTRDSRRYATYFPSLEIIAPETYP